MADIPTGIGYPAPVGGNQAVKDGSPLGQIPQGADLIRSHQAAVSLDVSRQYSRQPPFHPFSRQKKPLKSEI